MKRELTALTFAAACGLTVGYGADVLANFANNFQVESDTPAGVAVANTSKVQACERAPSLIEVERVDEHHVSLMCQGVELEQTSDHLPDFGATKESITRQQQLDEVIFTPNQTDDYVCIALGLLIVGGIVFAVTRHTF